MQEIKFNATPKTAEQKPVIELSGDSSGHTEKMRLFYRAIYSLLYGKIPQEKRDFFEGKRKSKNELDSESYYKGAEQTLQLIKDQIAESEKQEILIQPLDLFIMLIQFTDVYENSISVSEDLKQKCTIYAESILQRKEFETLDLSEQWNLAYKIANNNLEECLIILVLVSRLYARGFDKKALLGENFPEEKLMEDMSKWRNFTGYFDDPNESNLDGAGDTYYFWTNCAGIYLLTKHKSLLSKVFLKLFKNGTEIMVYVRKHLAKGGTIGSHNKATTEGRALGWELANAF